MEKNAYLQNSDHQGGLEASLVAEDQNSKKDLKVGFIHYFIDERSAGVNRVVGNNENALGDLYSSSPRYNFESVLIAGEFEGGFAEDFEKNGMKLKHLYDSSMIKDGRDWVKRIKRINNLLKKKNSSKLVKLVGELDLPSRIKYAEEKLTKNQEAIRNAYDHRLVALDLIKLLELPKVDYRFSVENGKEEVMSA